MADGLEYHALLSPGLNLLGLVLGVIQYSICWNSLYLWHLNLIYRLL